MNTKSSIMQSKEVEYESGLLPCPICSIVAGPSAEAVATGRSSKS